MIYKLIELIIAELSFMCGDRKHSMEFRDDLRTAVKALENIKKYFQERKMATPQYIIAILKDQQKKEQEKKGK